MPQQQRPVRVKDQLVFLSLVVHTHICTYAIHDSWASILTAYYNSCADVF